MERVFVLIPTHTARYLDLALVGLARQRRRADAVVVSCDVDDPAIGALIERWSNRLEMRVSWVRRAHHGVERLCQVRNNGVRHLVDDLGCSEGRLVTLDGDMLATPGLLAGHLEMGRGVPLIYPYRIDVGRAASEALDAARVLAGEEFPEASPADLAGLAHRARRYRRHLFLRRLGLGAPHKPKLLGGHFSVSLDLYLRLNGFDELYQGWGFKDDEFARRAARMGAACRVAVEELIAFHLFHTSRQQGKMRDLPTAERFARRDLPVVAEHGVRNTLPQHPVEATVFGP